MAIIRKAENHYIVQVGYRDAFGAYHRKCCTVHGGITAARKAERDLLNKRDAMELVTGRVTLTVYFDHFLEVRKGKPRRTLSTYKTKMAAALSTFGAVNLQEIRRPAVMKWLSALPGSGTTRRHQFATFKQVMEEARKDGLIVVNPLSSIATPRMDVKERETLTDKQFGELLKALGKATLSTELLAAALLMRYTGIRPGELLALKWSDVDLDKGELTIRAALDDAGNVKETKTGSERTIPLTLKVVEALKAQRSALAASQLAFKPLWQDEGFVLPALDTRSGRKKGRAWRPSAFHVAWRKAVGALGYTPYQLRHTCLTEWRRRGLRLELVQYLAGHAPGSSVTTGTYTRHISRDEMESVRR